jgi:hypothetical protein
MTQPVNDTHADPSRRRNWIERYRTLRETRVGYALFFFAFAVLELVGVAVAERDELILGIQQRTVFILGAVMFAAIGVACLAPGPMKALGKVLGVLVLVALVIGIVVVGANAVGAVPAAIIIGALIIAAAIRSR